MATMRSIEPTAAPPASRRRLSLPRQAWPRADRAAWERALSPASLLDDEGGLAASWRPGSREAVLRSYGRWLGFLARHGDLDDVVEPADRITPERIRAHVAELGVGLVSIAGHLARLVMAASALFPLRDWSWLRAMRSAVQRRSTPSRRKAGRIVSPAVLLDLGTTMMQEGQAGAASDPVPAARLYRDGLIIAFLALIPLRRGNLVALEIGRQLTRSSGGWIVAIPGEETKNHRPLVFTLPDALAAALDTYLAVHRPVLLAQCRGGGTAGLWLGATGRPLSATRVWRLVTGHTRQRLGVAVNPHLFRDCAATLLGDVDPKNVLLAAPLLGHSDFRTTEGHYIQAQTRGAFRAHHDHLEAMRHAAQGRARRVASPR
jgi:integrase/recombinase XerD